MRPRLTEKLMSGVSTPGGFVLLSGPAGFGKTTLLSEFAVQYQKPVAWLSLDEGDNDPIRFWTYLITACQSVQAGAGEAALALIRSPQTLPNDTAPTILINDLAEMDSDLVLVLDDYHAIQDPSIHASLSFLLEHLPKSLHVLVSTRTDPPWPLARWRARNYLIEIRVQDLRFTSVEAASFLIQTMGLSLSPEDVVALEERTEGWIAGLQLAALSMKGRSDVSGFIQAFTGSHTYKESLSQNLGNKGANATCLIGLAGLVQNSVCAARLLGAAEPFRDLSSSLADRADYERIVAVVRDQLDETTFAVAWEAGRSMMMSQAIEIALQDE